MKPNTIRTAHIMYSIVHTNWETLFIVHVITNAMFGSVMEMRYASDCRHTGHGYCPNTLPTRDKSHALFVLNLMRMCAALFVFVLVWRFFRALLCRRVLFGRILLRRFVFIRLVLIVIMIMIVSVSVSSRGGVCAVRI